VRLKRINLSDHVVEEIKARIMRGELKEGDRLPPHDLLSQELGVSRTTLREGLKNLTLMGILEMKPRRGTHIRSPRPSSFMYNLAPTLLMDRPTVTELMDARLALEVATVTRACKNADPSDLEEIEQLIQEMEGSLRTRDHARFSELDVRFHLRIAHASKNEVLERILEDIRGLLFQLLRETAQYIPGTQDPGQRYHRKILKALRNQDQELAEKAIRGHIASFARAIGQFQRMEST
jgi:GntR family transcriptional regulator, transcriptional repressor for pyruvate dehydrogenase complex